MRTTNEIIDALKRKLNVKLDSELCEKMDWSTPKVSHYRHHKHYLGPYECLQASEILKIPFEKIFAIAEAERTKRPDQKKRWQEIAKVASYVIALIVVGKIVGERGDEVLMLASVTDAVIHYTTIATAALISAKLIVTALFHGIPLKLPS